MPKTKNRNDALQAAHDKLQGSVAVIVSGDDWKRMLKVASNFHRYSFNNHLMIFCQRPDATLVAGFQKWKSLGRFVKKGEKGSNLRSVQVPHEDRRRRRHTEDVAVDPGVPGRACFRHLSNRRRGDLRP